MGVVIIVELEESSEAVKSGSLVRFSLSSRLRDRSTLSCVTTILIGALLVCAVAIVGRRTDRISSAQITLRMKKTKASHR
jgi:hypothetical protein